MCFKEIQKGLIKCIEAILKVNLIKCWFFVDYPLKELIKIT